MLSNRLNQYILSNRITKEQFAEKLTKSRGYPVATCQVSQWSTGIVIPSRPTKKDICIATEGQVPVDSWSTKRRTKKIRRGRKLKTYYTKGE